MFNITIIIRIHFDKIRFYELILKIVTKMTPFFINYGTIDRQLHTLTIIS